MINFDHVLEGFDLSKIHTVLSMIAFFLTVYVMQLSGHADREEGWKQRWTRRVVLASLALSMLWSLYYSETHQWQPWPSDLLELVALIGVMAFWAAAMHENRRSDVLEYLRNHPGRLSPSQPLPRQRVSR
jgi:peptidoglycan/LPS O-acetylase OafA/YrhL